jgi:hypothetical protein
MTPVPASLAPAKTKAELAQRIVLRHQKVALARLKGDPESMAASELLRVHGLLSLAEAGVISEAALRLLTDADGDVREDIDADTVSRLSGSIRAAASLRKEALASLIEFREQQEREARIVDDESGTGAHSSADVSRLSPVEQRMLRREADTLVESAKTVVSAQAVAQQEAHAKLRRVD